MATYKFNLALWIRRALMRYEKCVWFMGSLHNTDHFVATYICVALHSRI
jgi:hypothetical protein